MAFYKVNGQLAFWPDGERPPWAAGTYTAAADPNASGVSQAYINSPAYAYQKMLEQYKQRNPNYNPNVGLPKSPNPGHYYINPKDGTLAYDLVLPPGVKEVADPNVTGQTPPGGPRNPNTGGVPSGRTPAPSNGGPSLSNDLYNKRTEGQTPASLSPYWQYQSVGMGLNQGQRIMPRSGSAFGPSGQVGGQPSQNGKVDWIGSHGAIFGPNTNTGGGTNTSGIPEINPATGERDWTKMATKSFEDKNYNPKGMEYKPWQAGQDPGANMPYGRHPYDPANYWYKPGDLGYATRDDMYAGRSPWLYAYQQATMYKDQGYDAAHPYKTVENDPGAAWQPPQQKTWYDAAPNWDDPFNQKKPPQTPTPPVVPTPVPGGVGR